MLQKVGGSICLLSFTCLRFPFSDTSKWCLQESVMVAIVFGPSAFLSRFRVHVFSTTFQHFLCIMWLYEQRNPFVHYIALKTLLAKSETFLPVIS